MGEIDFKFFALPVRRVKLNLDFARRQRINYDGDCQRKLNQTLYRDAKGDKIRQPHADLIPSFPSCRAYDVKSNNPAAAAKIRIRVKE